MTSTRDRTGTPGSARGWTRGRTRGYVRQSVLDATFEYPTGGAEAIETALRIFAGQKVEKRIVLGSRLYTKENVDAGGAAVPAAGKAKDKKGAER